ncbi:hypothetical protein D018_1637A, partial [Vibrio parahaemolyticus VP2007-007]
MQTKQGFFDELKL